MNTLNTLNTVTTLNTMNTIAIELNVGLHVSATGECIKPSLALAVVESILTPVIIKSRVQQSSTEPTLIAKVKLEGCGLTLATVHDAIHRISVILGQDCIAVLDCDPVEHAPRHDRKHNLKGWLIGPRADAWGEFDGKYFILFDQPQSASHYAGHLPGSGVQCHSASPEYARHGLVLRLRENAKGRQLWEAFAHGHLVFCHPLQAKCKFGAMALLNGA